MRHPVYNFMPIMQVNIYLSVVMTPFLQHQHLIPKYLKYFYYNFIQFFSINCSL